MNHKRGFTLIEVIFSMWIVLLAIHLLNQSIMMMKKIPIAYTYNEDAIFIRQMQLLFALGSEPTIENEMLHFIYQNQEYYFDLNHQTLILNEGYQVYLNDVKDVRFVEKDNCIFIQYERDIQYEDIIGCL